MFRLSTKVYHPTLNILKSYPRLSRPTKPFDTKRLFKQNVTNKYPVSVSVSKVLPLAAFSTTVTSFLLKKPVHCEAVYAKDTIQTDKIITASTKKPLIRKGELTFGTFLGLCTGFLIKKVGKIFAMFVGTVFVFMQYLSSEGYITVHWDRFERRYVNTLDLDKDGRVTTRDIQSKWQKFMNILTNNIQFKSTFLAGFYVGIRFG
ncbi:hypothetical protein G6F47_009635 [Rhizopus delemar]|nr:hypothetical protein G6F49_009529 [Rhizopus delemar]KAG1591778.1 hypothetical protein G6F47_009635 [Rhizopus delemar]KAG1624161.1 hypothetical protein G6F45_010286 [Rhizopus arrhizus]KAG1630487.1 hypothetical protein G6F44_011322 [Rhizopus delemar]